ncbi:thioredoxin H1-like [Manihot esculenta]|uniref:Thioredoxin domain-containing protein n=1 Tax=Manihot esculenta TaxID=3983 RepID=A0A2C9UY78_MANES|nr:thioredoxin H1-like [Manihot esculenta]
MAEEGKVIASHTFEAWTEQFEKANRGKQLIVLDFSAAWCPHSRSMSPMLAELAKKMPNVTFLMVDANELCAVAMEWAVKVVPTFFFLKQGQLLDQFVGANVKQLISTIERHAGGAHGILESILGTNYPQPQVLIGFPNYSILGTNNGFPVNIPATPSTSIDMPTTTDTSTHHCHYPY